MYFTTQSFGEPRCTDGNWYVEINGIVRKKDRSISWTRDQMFNFWRRVCLKMRFHGVSNRHPLKASAALVRDPKYKNKRIPKDGNYALQIKGPVQKLKGDWSGEDCEQFREAVSNFMVDQGLVLCYQPTIWCMTSAKDSEEPGNAGAHSREVEESRVVVE